MAVELFDTIDADVTAPCKTFRTGRRYFNANAAELNRDAETLADVRLKYPYPPADCDQATTILQNIADDIKDGNEKMASGTGNNVVKRYLDSLVTVQGEFKAWLNAKQCVAAALKQQDDAFNQQLQTALNQEQDTQSSSDTTGNLIIFGSIFFLLIGAVVIIVKKKRKA